MLTKMKYLPGVIKDDTVYSSTGHAVDSDKIRFVRGRAESLGGYEDILLGGRFDGVCRGLHAWTDIKGNTFTAIGTHTKLYVEIEGQLYDVTPLEAVVNTATADPGSGPTLVDITQANHGLKIGDTVYALSALGFPNNHIGETGTFFLPNSFFTSEGSNLVTALQPGHGWNDGDLIDIVLFTPFNGVDLTGLQTVKVLDADTVQFGSDTEATATGFGGGSPGWAQYQQFKVIDVIDANTFTIDVGVATSPFAGDAVVYYPELAIGRVDSIRPGGYSLDTYSEGRYGFSPNPEFRADFQARTWALDNLVQFLVANPCGGKVYIWELNTSARATAVTNAPLHNDYMTVTAEGAIMVFGTIMTDATYDPLGVRWSDTRTGAGTPYTTWTPALSNLAGEDRLSVGSYIVAAKKTNSGIGVFTDTSFNIGQYVANVNIVYQFTHISTGCGLAGPNAVTEKDGTLHWFTPKVGFHRYESGAPVQYPCPVRRFVTDNVNEVQLAKVYAAMDGQYNAVYWFYPVSKEVDRYVRVDLDEMTDNNTGWSVGTTDMTAWLDRNPNPNPVSTRIDGMYCRQEAGRSANGDTISRHIEYAPLEIDDNGTNVINISKVIFDATCEGDIDLSLYLKRFPNAPLVVKGPYPQDANTLYTGIRGQGRQAGFLWRSFGANDYWRFGDVRFDTSQGPRR